MSDAATVEIADTLAAVRSEIGKAERDAGRSAGSVNLVAVSKTHGPDVMERALAAGHRLFGENRVQEGKRKWPDLRARFPDLRVHLIGRLQTNKVREALAHYDLIETLDRPKLAAALADEIQARGNARDCLVQVNTGAEPQKAGILPEDADSFIKEAREVYGLAVTGLMCIPPVGETPSVHFALLREIAMRNGLDVLSMGMSADFAEAIRFGATHVRVGTAIFGPRGDYR